MKIATKLVLLVGLCLFLSIASHGNAIDSLKSRKEVDHFYYSLGPYVFSPKEQLFYNEIDSQGLGPEHPYLQETEGQQISRLMHRSDNYYKIDVNKDGRTDLIIDGRYLIIVMDMGNNKFRPYIIDEFPAHIYFKDQIFLPDRSTALLFKLRRYQGGSVPEKFDTEIDTVVFKYNTFLDYSDALADTGIVKIEFDDEASSFGLGKDRHFYLNVNDTLWLNKKCSLANAHDSADMEMLKMARNLFAALGYVHVMALRDSYAIAASDLSTAVLHIYFRNGSEKIIRDYGEGGTIGLISIYKMIYNLRRFCNCGVPIMAR